VCIENNFEEILWGARFHHVVTKRFLNSVNLKPQNQRGEKKNKKQTLLPSQAKACSKGPKA
jgi:hypothetical protein